MRYISVAELDSTIRKNLHKIPHDVDFVIGIPRSGIICASIIAEFLNVPLVDANSFIGGAKPTGGYRLRHWEKKQATLDKERKQKVLVVDDTVFNGNSMKSAKTKLKPFEGNYDFVYMAVFLEGRAADVVDIWFEDVRKYTNNFTECVLYEWNLFHHNENIMLRCMYDIDGVLCVNPPDERNEKEYIKYIKNATPLFIPSTKIGALVTYRLIKNREITQEWLKQNNVQYQALIMFNAQTWEERNNSGVSPSVFKGNCYKSQEQAMLFVESDDTQARQIFEISGKPVYCVESNRLYSQ